MNDHIPSPAAVIDAVYYSPSRQEVEAMQANSNLKDCTDVLSSFRTGGTLDDKAAELAMAMEDEPCQSGPSDLSWEGRERDRSGTRKKVRKWKNREKARAARKARKVNR